MTPELTGRREWTNHEVDVLADLFPHCATALISSQLGRSEYSIRSKASELGIKKTLRRIKKAGVTARAAGIEKRRAQ